MPELLQEYWIFVIAALVLGVLVAWWVFHASRRTRVEIEERSEEEKLARRNQALIDAPPAAVGREASAKLTSQDTETQEIAKVSPGPLSAAANVNDTAAAGAEADAEAGAPGSAREALEQIPPGETPAPSQAEGDDLTRIKGLGPKLVTILGELGVTRFAQIAAWDDADIDRIDPQLGRFEGRIRRDDWVEQARLLAAGDTAGYEGRFGKL